MCPPPCPPPLASASVGAPTASVTHTARATLFRTSVAAARAGIAAVGGGVRLVMARPQDLHGVCLVSTAGSTKAVVVPESSTVTVVSVGRCERAIAELGGGGGRVVLAQSGVASAQLHPRCSLCAPRRGLKGTPNAFATTSCPGPRERGTIGGRKILLAAKQAT